MALRTVLVVHVLLFSLIGLLHLLRILFQWNIVFGTWFVPYWLNVLALLLAFLLLYLNIKQLRKLPQL